MINVYTATDLEVHYLKKLKENYGISNKQIALALNKTQSDLSCWFNNKRKPSKTSREKIQKFLHETWQPGIIELPPTTTVWNGPYYLRVMDTRNPFETWIDCDWSGNEPKDHPQMIKEWEKQCEKDGFRIMRIYASWNDFQRNARNDEAIYNCTREIYYDRPIYAYSHSRPNEIAWDLIKEYEQTKNS